MPRPARTGRSPPPWPTTRRPTTCFAALLARARGRHRRPCSWSRTSTGPTTPRSTCSATPRGGSSRSAPCSCSTFRDDEPEPAAPLQRLLGGLAGGPVRRLALPPLSPAAVAALAAGSGVDAAALHRVTARQPVLRHRGARRAGDAVPDTVVEAVQARVGRLSPACRAALEQLSVVPSRVRLELAAALLGDGVDALAEAERAGMVEVGPPSLGFRHELARRAVERGLPRAAPAARSTPACSSAARAASSPDRASLMHFAVEAGDVDTVLAVGPARRARGGPRRRRTGRRSPTSRRCAPHARPARPSASARPCSTTSAGSSTTPTASARRSRPAAPRPRCTSGSATARRSAAASCGCPATCSWRARPTRPTRAPTAP